MCKLHVVELLHSFCIALGMIKHTMGNSDLGPACVLHVHVLETFAGQPDIILGFLLS